MPRTSSRNHHSINILQITILVILLLSLVVAVYLANTKKSHDQRGDAATPAEY